MPKKYTKFQKKKKRYGYRKRRVIKRRSRYAPVRQGFNFPDKTRVKLNYSDYVAVSTSAGTNFYEIIMRANSLYDPMYSGMTANKQPIAFDQWTQFYKTYRVKGAKITYTIQPSSATVAVGAQIAIIHANISSTADTTTYADDPDTLMCQKDVKVKYISPSGSATPFKVSMYKTTKQLLPRSNPEDIAAPVGTNPTDSWYFHFCLWDQTRNAASGTVAALVDCKMTFYCEFYDINDLAAS